MNVSHSRWMLSALSAAAIASLTACGGNGDSGVVTPVPPTTPTAAAVAQDDTESVTWNKATALDVTSNDTITNGTATVTVSVAPAHGTATVDGNKITYTPTTGYFGADTLKYLLSVGDKTAEGNVTIAVGAQMTISGTVHDDVMPGAQVVATVAGVDLPGVTADASGNYSVTINTNDPSAFISLKATGVGAQSNVVLASLVGDAATAAAATDTTSGTVNAAALPSADVTNISTAIAVLSQQALGKAPTSSADLAAAQGQFTSTQTVQMATAIKLVADAGIALPAGSADTLALVSDPTAFTSFVATQVSTNADLFSQTAQAVLSDPTLSVAAPTPVAGAPDQTFLLVIGEGAASNIATRLTLQSSGKAIVEADTVRTGTWTSDGSQINVTYDTPSVTEGDSNVLSDGFQHGIETTETGFKMRQIGSSNGAGTATISSISTYKYTDGPLIGNVVSNGDYWQPETLVGAAQSFGAADFSVGTRWSGLMSTDFSPLTSYYSEQDTITVVDAATVKFERSGQTAGYVVTNGKLVITAADGGVFTYTRLFTGPQGEERWLVEKSVAGTPVWNFESEMVKAQAGVSFTAAGLAQRWESYINIGLEPNGNFFIDLSADGSARNIGTDLAGNEYPTNDGTWNLTDAGQMTYSRNGCAVGCSVYQIRTWQLIAQSGSRIYVMEHLVLPGSGYDQWRTNIYTAPTTSN